MMTTEAKAQAIKSVAKHKTDSGSTQVQVALLSERISQLTAHMKTSPKDFHSRRGLMQMVGQRKRLLKYLKASDSDSYQDMIKRYNIRG